MRLVVILWALVLSGCAGSQGAGLHGAEPDSRAAQHAFVNGRWFDGNEFQAATWYAVQGRLTRQRPDGPVGTVDLSGRFIVPPFGEAHNHNVEGTWNVDTVAERYLHDGVFYVKNPNNVREFALQVRGRVNVPGGIDATFAHAGLTGKDGHPIALYEDVLRVSRYRDVIGPGSRGWFENRAYIIVETDADVDEKWALITSGQPDFLKVYLVRSEDDEAHRLPEGSPARRGLHPRLVPHIVGKAHAAGLQVTAHVETAADFRSAVQSGVDEIAHVPGWLVKSAGDVARARLTEADARSARERNVRVVTTTVAGHAMPTADARHSDSQHEAPAPQHSGHAEPALDESAGTVLKDNLSLLHRSGVRLAVGSDHADTSLAEALHLHSFGIFDNRTLLKMWCESTPAAIFPGRKIGRFEEGYEASFLALAGNPLDDFSQVRSITHRVKQGRVLDGHFASAGDAVTPAPHAH